MPNVHAIDYLYANRYRARIGVKARLKIARALKGLACQKRGGHKWNKPHNLICVVCGELNPDSPALLTPAATGGKAKENEQAQAS